METPTKIALVTGGSRGLGKDMALSIAKKNIDVILTYKNNKSQAMQVVQEVENIGRKAAALYLDMSDFNSLDNFLQQVLETLQSKWNVSSFDFLINNAGIGATV